MIYADYNATTPVGEGARREMERAIEHWGNPSSTHRIGRKAADLLEKWRETVATALAVKPTEVVFTSGGSEANGMVLLGSALAKKGSFRLLTSPVEHSSVDKALPMLRECIGAEIDFVKIRHDGTLDMDAFASGLKARRPDLVSLMTANNETGVIFPVPEIARICREEGIPFHTDATQALGKLPPRFFEDADFFTVSGHKIFGPKGVGALVIRRGLKLACTRFGGSQEIKRRGGTQNMLGIAGFAGACAELAGGDCMARLGKLRDRFEHALTENLPDVHIQGREAERVPNTTSVRFVGVPSDILMTSLDIDGLCVSGGSACSSGSVSPSHVLLAMGLTETEAREGVRVSWGRPTTEEEIDEASRLVIHHVNRIRERRARRKA